VQEVAAAIGANERIGLKFLHLGPGNGGPCFPKITVLITNVGFADRGGVFAPSRPRQALAK
jgi:UDP-glucose 6-dehydrogenase